MKVIADCRLLHDEEDSLRSKGYDIIKCPLTTKVYEGISGHPDIQLCILEKGKILVHKDINNDFKASILASGAEIYESEASLTRAYPGDIILNALCTEKYFIHNLKYTDKRLKSMICEREMIDVNQGYTKCSILPINEKAFITNDPSIKLALKAYDIKVLLLPYGDILLPGFNYGFIGGCGGVNQEGELLLFGDLSCYKYASEIMSFLIKEDVKPISLSKGPLKDRGSLLFL